MMVRISPRSSTLMPASVATQHRDKGYASYNVHSWRNSAPRKGVGLRRVQLPPGTGSLHPAAKKTAHLEDAVASAAPAASYKSPLRPLPFVGPFHIKSFSQARGNHLSGSMDKKSEAAETLAG